MGGHRPARTGDRTPGEPASRFPGFDVLGEIATWDAVTAGVVLARLETPPALRFFNPREEATGRALLDQLLDQRDDPRIPVLETIDGRLADARTDGWHYEDMPDDGQAWRDSLRALDADAQQRHAHGFAGLAWHEQSELIQAVRDRAEGRWHAMPAAHVWSLWTRYAATAFYAHPEVWNEIGFGGPAYPRGYRNLGLDRREPWEVPDAQPDRNPVGVTAEFEANQRREAAGPHEHPGNA